MEELNLTKRIKTASHGARKVRREGKIPGVIYGKEMGNEIFTVDESALLKEISASGEHGIVKFNLDGKKGNAVIKEIQRNALGNKAIHVDFEEVAANDTMHTEVLIKIIGKGILESKGLILQTQRDLVKVSCKAKDLPKDVELDVSDGQAGTVYTFKNLKFAEGIEVLDDLSTVIGSISEEEKAKEEEAE
ncbi:50S ribosomal protein L25 [Clostridium beijerinckii]|jgi:large subunit ribosomal protein L25|uniref:Large ribosomal subunit protein bL25 n=1 Tax=Clostridium beijerinckii TaxID=1520 RepID=A0A1S9N3E7_CLOBE|nr:50S ribosomal protein L25 [Clostridium beijerinckii]MBC2457717.1 50S ribosomal protein L25 [Clostridium beijerinckii]MBC2475635.1 50S ribosomal protein L25 [Clostridium beijerinckii]MCI1477284.1 50S ribosomal protein L25 [Clostridium beijerinckii]MCI1577095.1 50S ribosomal protein L25 [Clostridium beijerinckii]MCI1584063.1 50S ribosomal protein L25 [Clostridium beijerinckii]